jgi:hypothetical protein
MATTGSAIYAIAKGTTWGTAVSVNAANNGFKVSEVSEFIQAPETLVDGAAGKFFEEQSKPGKIIVKPTLGHILSYTGAFWRFFAYLIGDDALTTGGSAEKIHTMDVQDLTDLFGTLCHYDGIDVREMPSFMPTKLTITGKAGDFWRWNCEGIGDDVLTEGQTNTTLGSVTNISGLIDTASLFGESDFQMNNQSAGAVSSSDRIKPIGCTITIERPKDSEFLARGVARGAGENKSDLPKQQGLMTTEVQLDFPEATAHTFLEEAKAGTLKKMVINTVGPIAIAAIPYSHVWSFPALFPMKPSIKDGGENQRLENSVVFKAQRALAAPTGMTGITKLFRLVVTDIFATAYDA